MFIYIWGIKYLENKFSFLFFFFLRFYYWQNEDIERLLSISHKRKRKKKIIAPHSVCKARFISRQSGSTESLCLHTDEHTRSLIALEASFRRVFFPNFVTTAVICSRLFVHSLHRFACLGCRAASPTFDLVSSSYDWKSPQVRLRPPHRRGR